MSSLCIFTSNPLSQRLQHHTAHWLVKSNGLLFWGHNCRLFSCQLGGLYTAAITISILDKKTSHEQRAKRTAAHCAFTSYWLPHKRLHGKLKGRPLARLLASFFPPFFLSLALFMDGKGSFKPLRIAVVQALYRSYSNIKTLETDSNSLTVVLKYWLVHSDWWQRRTPWLLGTLSHL